ncbi:MAG TPA: helix-turn-helix domain-containing protein [Acidimicrobiales bacterium]|jgi:AcrR family transcriptional regulator|nr:helix-turn-helix domain-containing protein [Acidimicrobiales bacterium]
METASAAPTTTRQRILDVAMERFTEQGYEATSLREIAEPLGFTKAALYYHFRSKEEILRALMEPAIGLQRRLIEGIEGAQSLEDWAELLTWMVDEMFANYLVFKLADRNRSAVETLAESSEFFEDHIRLHAEVEAAATRPDISLTDRVRIVCALGSVVSFDDFGGKLLDGEPRDRLRAELLGVVRSILGLPPEAPTG